MSIRDWPEQERPREKLLRCGASGLSDAELLAVLLCTGVAGKSAVDVARELLQHFGGLRPLLQAEQRQLCALPGLGPAKFVLLQAVLEIGKRHLGETLRRGAPLGNPDQTRAFIRAQLRDHSIEVFGCLFLDNRNRVIRFEELARGTLDSASVHPREVIKKALQYNAGAVIFAHNHPSGVAEPSQADRRITARLQQGLALVDIRVLDHIVVGDSETVSFAERGLL